VEEGPSELVFAAPQHPYTQALFASVLPETPAEARVKVPALGEIPSPLNPPSGCHFHPRCKLATEKCQQQSPKLATVTSSQRAACFYIELNEVKAVNE